jgi:CubicO group peptidase (beta-lactamase class C family)
MLAFMSGAVRARVLYRSPLLLLLLLFRLGELGAGAALPASGPVVPGLEPIQRAMTNFMASLQFSAGTLALMKDSKLVLRTGYGWRDTNKTEVIHPDCLFRLASVSKTLTAVAIRKLVSNGQLSYATRVYSYLGIPPAGGVLGDERITNITVQHLLDHQGGWDNTVSPVGDPVFRTIQVSTELGLNYPAQPTNMISWMLAKPLDFAPGSKSVYANFGFQILGRVVEKASGKPYFDYLAQDVFGPFGITNIIQSRSRPADLPPWEIWYDDGVVDDSGLALMRSAVDYPSNQLARFVDGGAYYESFDAFGGVSASALDLCRYLLRYWEAGAARVPGSVYNWGYLFYGSLPGTTTVLSQSVTQNSTRTNGLEFAALFNKRMLQNDNEAAYNAINNATTNVTSWPTNGGGRIEWQFASINVPESAGAVSVRLVRTGSSTRPIQISYTTYSKTAGLDDYVPTSGVLSFAAGETFQDISVTILDDQLAEPTEEVLLELISAAGGAWLGDRVTCVLRIVDNDSVTGFVGPAISSPPASQTVAAGGDVTFSVAATGTPPLAYQWRQNGLSLSGATNATLNVSKAQLAQLGAYTVVISNAGASITSAPAHLLVFAPGRVVGGGLRREVYSGISGGSIGDLHYSPNFPDLPSSTTVLASFELPVNSADNYGVRLSGFVLPPTTGDYTFYLSSDDQSVLWLSTDEQPANLRLIAAEPVYNESRAFIAGINQASRGTPPFNISSPILLEAGRRYYVTALMKEGNGSDHFAVAWRPPGGPAVTNGSPPIPGTNLAYVSLPPIVTSQPDDQIVPLGGTATFAVTTMGTTPLRYQWRRNGASIAGATNRILTLEGVPATSVGNYSLFVSNPFGVTTSRVARLSYLGFTPPRLTGPLRLSNGVFYAQITGATGLPVRAEISTNLLTWQTLQSLTNVSGLLPLTDPNASLRDRTFYRALVP